jgi:hypothetical protein
MLFEIIMENGTKREIELLWKSKNNILGVNKAVNRTGYSITHLKTGMRITGYGTKKETLAMAKALLRECPPSTWVFITEAESVKTLRKVLDVHTPLNSVAKTYEESLIKAELT